MSRRFADWVLVALAQEGPARARGEAGACAYARAAGIHQLWTAGDLCIHAATAFGAGARHFSDAPAVIAALADAPVCASVLVKGSKFMHMPTVVAALQQRAAATQTGGTHAA